MQGMLWSSCQEDSTERLYTGLRSSSKQLPNSSNVSYRCRVVQPPPDQQNHTRLGVFYFCMTDDDVKLTPLTDSPVLKRVGLQRRFADEEAPTMEVWRKGRTSAYGQSQLKPAGSRVEEEIINGVVVKHYN